jgi:D-alanine-D-alanine ligase
MPSYRVGVLFGSRSTEHEVSVVTALQVMGFLAPRHTVIPIYITKEGRWLTGKKLLDAPTYQNLNLKDPELSQVIITPDTGIHAIANPLGKGLFGKPEEIQLDVVFPAFHGSHGEDGTIQGLLELANIPYVGSDTVASALCIDKQLTKLALSAAGIPVLEGLSFTRLEWEARQEELVSQIEARFPYPVIVKPCRLGSSIGIAVAHDADELRFNISVASRFDAKLLVEPCLENKIEINCSVLGFADPQPSVCEQPVSSGAMLSFQDKYLQGARTQGMQGAKRIIPAPISEELTKKIQGLAVQAFKLVGASGVARIDFMVAMPEEKVYLNEINPLPGSIAYYLWQPSGLTPQQLVDRLLELAFEAHKEKSRSNYSQGQPLLENINLLNLRKD